MKELEITVRVRNNRLKELRTGLGLSQPALAEKIGISLGLYAGLENLRQSPLSKKTGEWREAPLKIALFYENFGVALEDLFPDSILAINGPSVAVRKFDGADLSHQLSTHTYRMLEGPEKNVERAELREEVKKVLSTLKPREQRVLCMRYGLGDQGEGGMTLEEVGKDEEFDVTRNRIRQIECKALRTLRHPSRSKRLRSFVEGE